MGRLAAIIVVSMLGLAGASQAQTIFKCRDAKGQMSFQHQPCDGDLRGAVTVQPSNVVEGRPTGDKQSRIEAERSRRVRSGLERGEVVEGMTQDEARQAVQRKLGPALALQPCYSATEIRNAEVGADRFKSTPYERRANRREIERMRNCVR